MKPVYAFLHAYAPQPFVWGSCDCCLLLADWVRLRSGRDPAAHLRHTYSDAGSCQRVTGWFTDPVALVESCLDTVRGPDLPCPRVKAPAPGDIAVIDIPLGGRLQPVGALWTGSVWGVKAQGGAGTIHRHGARLRAAWGVGCAQ